ncbi:methyltransferase [Ruegeria sp. 2205SS24-7]|uniref:class I SAM-dependent methyltransferase n=1 Tax=Ruegeria discodermiae TaxID=3064389 RepID=UPI002741128A|nr:methyltransferase [Ruegeria sp. 2205SS24-7]MDP5217541.1 methyltransferase [Ruegeria sp. 2205SS24-7]
MSIRLDLARDSGLTLSDALSVLLPTPAQDLSDLPRTTEMVQPFKPFHDHFADQGFRCAHASDARCDDVILFLPRAKTQARGFLHQACQRASGRVVVDGAKTDGIDSLLKEVRKRVPVEGPISKAHGKIFWFAADAQAFSDWAMSDMALVGGYRTVPGVFSSDGIDPASELLIAAMPDRPGGRIADLGAGWGYLSSRLLEREGVYSIDLVEADHAALECARHNVSDPRARFHWADALRWAAPEPEDTVVMNPPFHTSRAADPALGRGFIAAAARALAPNGQLWMVANRHLPYEAALEAHFNRFEELGGDARFKIFNASRPRRRVGAS